MRKRRSPNDFRFHKLLGSGAFSQVFFASSVEDDKREFALKMIDKNLVVRARMQEQVFKERDIMIRLVHPNIVNLCFTFQTQSHLFFVLELCHGGTLFNLLEVRGKLSIAHTTFYTAEIASALSYLHGKNIAHRDLKPENMLLTHDGHVKLADFGAAKEILLAGDEEYTVTTPVQREDSGENYFGTAEYSAPELLQNSATPSQGLACDLWALGCSVYFMLVGSVLFHDETEYLVFNRILHFDPQEFFDKQFLLPPFSHASGDAMKDFIRSVLIPDPADRPPIATVVTHQIFNKTDFPALSDADGPRLPRAAFSVPPPRGRGWGLCCGGCVPFFCFSEEARPQTVSITLDDDEYFELLS
jgi:serine/threonine protein kinase